ncbi:TetR family transcriptional regulator [Streptomyces sp. NRRL F-2580]|uniref:TetR family transcriptional regulator n=1 Tax=Streptomyces sp. NRRL F-2580 TaxID=1463841 RepID=UPI0004CC801E|nr:TetR family transcriptional regulator [Streptomyces sp. NRRL F-2580]
MRWAAPRCRLNDVARRAGLGVGAVYRHFATPEALLESFLFRTVVAQVTDASLAPVTAAATDALSRTPCRSTAAARRSGATRRTAT